MAHPLPKHETTAFRPVGDDEHLVGRELHIVASLMIEAFGTRGIAHAHRYIMSAGRQEEALIDSRRTVASDTSGRKAGPIDIAAVDVELDIDRPPAPRTFLHPPHIGRQLGN